MSAAGQTFVPALARAVTAAHITDAEREIARTSVLDTAACIVAGWFTPQAVAARAAHVHSGSAGAGPRALVLGTAAHALDYDDYEESGSTHPSAVLVPVTFALADTHHLTFADAEAAYVNGYRTILALGQSMGYDHYMAGWHATSTLGTVGATVCAGSLFGLDTQRMIHALSIAMTQAAGLKKQFGFDTKALHAGLAARNGIDAASLAYAGASGSPDVFEDPVGFASVYGGKGIPFLELPSIESFPPWRKLSPSCGYTLRAIDAAQEMFAKEISAAQIACVRVNIADAYAKVAPFRAPKTAAEARFSVSWCVAAALLDGHVTVSHFEDQGLARVDLRNLEAKIEIVPYPLPKGAGDMAETAPDTVHVDLANGQKLSATSSLPKGAATRPLSKTDLNTKLSSCGLDMNMVDRFRRAKAEQRFDAHSLLPSPLLEDL